MKGASQRKHNRTGAAGKTIILCCIIFYTLLLSSCTTLQKEAPLFEALDSSKTGLGFNNRLTPSPRLNMFNYMYFYNGAGAGAGDFNNDGLIDLFFASNQGENKLYLNTGNLKFKDATTAAKIPQDGGWSTGVSVVDINNDGLLDIYVCRVGNYEVLQSRNQFLICTGIDENGAPAYTDKAKEYGLDFSGFGTQAAFFDYDLDGDLDVYLMNHSLRFNGTFSERKTYFGTVDSLAGDFLYRNDKGRFTDVSKQSGIISSIIGYGLGIAVSDINLDGYPDLYIGNDFHENDYLYINQRNGTFKEVLTEQMMHTSQFSMGVDAADINNDAYPEVISMDMLPADPYILKRSLGEDEYNTFNSKIRYGYNHQYARNNLQLNRGNGMFSEVGLYAGVFATDWSWASLFVDFDNDGLKDLFVSNGIPKRLNDMDYVNYVSNDEIQQKIRSNSLQDKDMALVNKFPEIKLPNKFFRNKGDALFEDMEKRIEADRPTYSNGAVYADFDNDGDLDIVVNNIDDPVLLYQNKSSDGKRGTSLQIKLKGPAENTNAIGAKIIVYAGNSIMAYEKYPVRGFQSSMEMPVHVGLDGLKADSIFVIWPDNAYQNITSLVDTSFISISYNGNLPEFDYRKIAEWHYKGTKQAVDITDRAGINFLHRENPFVEFDREQLIPFMVSREGPALAVADINGDGLEDVFIGSSKGTKSAVFIQQSSGIFKKTIQQALDNDSTYEEVDACWTDVNNDKHPDLVVASGGNEYYGRDKHRQPGVYINNGRANLVKLDNAFDSIYLTASVVVPYDFTGDGFVDLFIGARAEPFEYGKIPRSYLLQNDATGRFNDVTAKYSNGLAEAGLVKHAVWVDIDKDGDNDLILSLEWDGICAFINNKGHFTKKYLTDKRGWWNFTLPCDVDGDGDIDLIAGNLGLNSRLKASQKEPLRLYYNDFDGNGKNEQVLTYYLGAREIPFANKDELQKQMPGLKKKFLYAEDFAKASLKDLLGSDQLNKAQILTAGYFSNAVLINNGNLNFSAEALPLEAQLTSYKDAVITDANNDNLPDILLAGNFYENNIQMGRYDADFGTILINKGGGKFTCSLLNGLVLKGQVRRIRNISIGGHRSLIIARNNDSVKVIRFVTTAE